MWLDRDMQWLAAPSGKRGRRQTFSDAAIQFCLSIKCLFGQGLRQTLGLVATNTTKTVNTYFDCHDSLSF